MLNIYFRLLSIHHFIIQIVQFILLDIMQLELTLILEIYFLNVLIIAE